MSTIMQQGFVGSTGLGSLLEMIYSDPEEEINLTMSSKFDICRFDILTDLKER
jgi:hypothetical protein